MKKKEAILDIQLKNITDPDLVNVKALVDTGLKRKTKKKKKKAKKTNIDDI